MADPGISLNRSDQLLQARFQQRHYAVVEVSEMWNLSTEVARKIF